MKFFRGMTALCLSTVLTMLLPFSSLAEAVKPESMDEETWQRLQDNILEYDEIGDLVENYNPDYLQMLEQIDSNTQIYEDAAKEFREVARDNRSEARAAKDNDDLMLFAIYEGTARGYTEAAKGYEKVVKSIQSNTRHQRRKVWKMLTSGVQQLMNGYQQALASKELVDTAVELAQAAYDSTVTQRGVGMATDTDVESALKSLQSAQGQQKVLEDTMTSLKQNLCLMTGREYNASVDIKEIPAPDLAGIDYMNPENDLTKAIGNNYTVIEQRNISGKGTANYDNKMRILDESEAKIKTQLESLYQAVLESKTAYDAANTAFAGAQITMNGNDLKYQMGMLGRLEYLQLKMVYLQQKAAVRTAELNLTQAMENYNWAVEGLADIE